MDSLPDPKEVADQIRLEAEMGQRVCAFMTACDSNMEEVADEILQEMVRSENPDDLRRFVFGLAGMAGGFLYAFGVTSQINPQEIIARFAMMNEITQQQSDEIAVCLVEMWRENESG